MARFLLFSFSMLLLSSCFNEDQDVVLHSELEPYFQTFKEEASDRGIDFDHEVEGISAIIRGISTNGVIGECAKSNDSTKIITIDRSFWDSFNDFQKELVVYHELGHCFLDRPHCDKINSNNTCFSIMHSSEDLCDNNYNLGTREEFIDELFDIDYEESCQ